MNFVPETRFPATTARLKATSGEFAGWWTWTRDQLEVHNGPFWHREENGKVRCVFPRRANASMSIDLHARQAV